MKLLVGLSAIAGVTLAFMVALPSAHGAGAATQEASVSPATIEATAVAAPIVMQAMVQAVKKSDDGGASDEGARRLEITLDNPTMLKGDKPSSLTLPFKGDPTHGFSPKAGQDVVAIISHVLTRPIMGGPPTLPGPVQPIPTEWRIVLLAPATAENIAAAKAGVAQSPQGKLKAAVRSAELVFVATVDKVSEFGHLQPPLLQVTVKDLTMLKGDKPARLECPYPLPPAAPALFRPQAGDKVLIAASAAPKEDTLPANSVSGHHSGPLPMAGGNGPPILFMTSASPENVELAKAALAAPTIKPADVK
jgi:hypothetical protein